MNVHTYYNISDNLEINKQYSIRQKALALQWDIKIYKLV